MGFLEEEEEEEEEEEGRRSYSKICEGVCMLDGPDELCGQVSFLHQSCIGMITYEWLGCNCSILGNMRQLTLLSCATWHRGPLRLGPGVKFDTMNNEQCVDNDEEVM
ncbi:hypothetical protein AgCh_015386 [Apium graveolens]